MDQKKSMNELNELFAAMWTDYCQITPAARQIFDLITAQNETVLNDHIALRTFNLPGIRIDDLATHFTRFGYQEAGEYHFKEKKLYAKHWQHSDLNLPKVFISELLVEEMPKNVQNIIHSAVNEMPKGSLEKSNFLFSGRPWKMTYKSFLELSEVSEYAAWMCAWGFRPNHFTVNINHLKQFNDITKLNTLLKENGFELNAFGGEIKGTPEEMLEQSSIMASKVSVEFSDGIHMIPGCYYEFAKRYRDAQGKIYHGFIAKSADKIFESTNRN